MQYYFAPMEGLTDSIYRRLHHKYFPGVDTYFTPFFSPTIHHALTNREARELPYADTLDFTVVPQVLTKNAADFLWMAQQCQDRGYKEINLNLGCPSGTVVSKGKGSGMLAKPLELDDFLEEIFAKSPLPISVKTRLGLNTPEEFPKILEILNDFPITELTVHPRIRKVFYNGPVLDEWFAYAAENYHGPLCYNGNVNTLAKAQALPSAFPGISSIMIGRGLIGDPGMLTPGGTTVTQLEAFHEELLEEYIAAFGGSRNAMFRLKEHWKYLLCRFEPDDKIAKQLRKTTDLQEYRSITHQIFHTLPLLPELAPNW